VQVQQPERARGWYFDGGTRLSTPVKPAIAFGAGRVVAVALTSSAQNAPDLAGERRPDALEGAAQILIGLLEDQLAADVQTLASINELLTVPGRATGTTKRRLPYILVAPSGRDPIAERALRVVREQYSRPLQAITSDVALLARLTAAGDDVHHAALISFLLFAPEFAQALIELGRQDASRWLEEAHDFDGLWQVGPLPAVVRHPALDQESSD